MMQNYKKERNHRDSEELHSHINKIYKWEMEFNANKCRVMPCNAMYWKWERV